MSTFAPIGNQAQNSDGSFWPSFTDIMMVVVMIFLFATSILIVRNYHLVAELQDSLAAEKIAEQRIESTTLENLTLEQRLSSVENEIASATQENATLEERLINYEQENSLLRLQVLAKEEKLRRQNLLSKQQKQAINQLETQNSTILATLKTQQRTLQENDDSITSLKIEVAQFKTEITQYQTELSSLSESVASKESQNVQLSEQNTELSTQLTSLQSEFSQSQNQLTNLTQSKQLSELTIEELKKQKAAYNQELLTLKGEYEVVQAKYQKLIKPARSARGKYIAEVHYLKSENKNQISYKEPADLEYKVLELSEVEKKLNVLRAKYGKELYVKIIIPKNSGLTYSEAWTFMKNLLDKYDYYYQK